MLDKVTNTDLLINSQLEKNNEVSKLATNPITNPYANIDKNLLIDESAISNEALKLFEKDSDIKYFTKMVLNLNGESDSIMETLFANGVVDPFSDEAVSELVDNAKLLADLEK
jgi:hypothetical protein